MPSADAERAKAFYGDLFGWELTPGTVPGGFNIEGSTPPGGLFAGGDGESPAVYFDVDDIEAAVAQIRELGGEAEQPQQIQTGWMAACKDDQGKSFNIWQRR